MKKVNLIIIPIGLISLLSCAQENKVSEAAEKAFKTKFPAVSKVKWEKEAEGEWEAEFKLDGVAYSSNFKTDGTWLETERSLKMKDVPSLVSEKFLSEFASYKLEKIEEVQKSSGTVYEFVVENKTEEIEAIYSPEGKLLEKKVEKEAEEKEDEKD